MTRWLAGMPAVARQLWDATNRFRFGAGLLDSELTDLRMGLARDMPDPAIRIRSLLRWFGSREGPWSGVSSWESVPELLLLEYATADIVSAVAPATVDRIEREGAARLFAGREFGLRRPHDRDRLPASLKRALLEHTIETGDAKDEDRRDRARRAFGPAEAGAQTGRPQAGKARSIAIQPT